jgi:hypothetical protein
MSVDQLPITEIIDEKQAPWRTDRQPAGCTHCLQTYLATPDQIKATCPLCRRGILESQPARMRPIEPEKVLPFQVARQNLLPIYQNFVSSVWIKPEDFKPEALLQNTRPVFWPLWLVDSDVGGDWQMEAGFDYKVESTKEVFGGGRWESQVQIQTRVRWEPRAGKLATHVDNVITPALETHDLRQKMTGAYHLDRASAFDPHLLGAAYLELPDLPPKDAWLLARPHFDKALAEICQKAAGAQHSRHFSLNAEFSSQIWTEFLLPIYTTHYTDDEGQPQLVVVNGQTGAINGPRLASHKRGMQIAGILAGIAGAIFLLALIGLLMTMVFPPAALIAGLLGILGLGLGIGAVVTALWPRQWNRGQQERIFSMDRS